MTKKKGRKETNVVDKGICFFCNSILRQQSVLQMKVVRPRNQLIGSPLSIVPGVSVGK